MNAPNTKPGSGNLLKWPALSVLFLLWALGALVSVLFGKIGQGGNALAAWAMDRIEDLST